MISLKNQPKNDFGWFFLEIRRRLGRVNQVKRKVDQVRAIVDQVMGKVDQVRAIVDQVMK